MAKQDERFIKVYEQGMINCMEIWVDRETGVNYLFHFNGNAARIDATAGFGRQARRDRIPWSFTKKT